ncbi:MAG TPA: vitamin B12 dependent-methionine synthase activation domain-containing protein [Candidatus Kapabacteria bacterium]|nr:vitamin B12 dependent-methionine synthase activation domain-containing protein [Candidatus Kapabacteria bacterium]
MKKIINIPIARLKPDVTGVLRTQGIPPPPAPLPSEKVTSLYHSAEELFLKLAAPISIMSEITVSEFAEIYKGNGLNEVDSALEKIFPQAAYLALFAFTIGAEVSLKIEEQLSTGNFALGYMLDAVSSYCTDKASEAAEEIFVNDLATIGQVDASLRVLLYSPGYCGWHISGQQKLFEYLQPGAIGIHLNENFLMSPLKSISGVLVAGEKEIHSFKNNYPFCKHCRSCNCRARITRILK